MLYTLGQAAKATGLSKMTIQRALKSGRISGQKDDTGSYQIDPSELHRVFPPVTASDSITPVAVGQNETPSSDTELRVAKARLEAEVAGLTAMVEELRRARDKWEAQAERLALMPPQPVTVQVQARSWWPWARRA